MTIYLTNHHYYSQVKFVNDLSFFIISIFIIILGEFFAADVIILNNVFEFFVPLEVQERLVCDAIVQNRAHNEYVLLAIFCMKWQLIDAGQTSMYIEHFLSHIEQKFL